MSKVITFSRTFPSYHPRKGEPTYFVEKILQSLDLPGFKRFTLHDIYAESVNPTQDEFLKGSCNPMFKHEPKYHTIRAGHRFKAGDWFSPRVWPGKPYNTKQIIIAPDIQIPKIWNFEMKFRKVGGELNLHAFINKKLIETPQAILLATNDGLTLQDFTDWFYPKGGKFIVGLPIFDGQIICWNEDINY